MFSVSFLAYSPIQEQYYNRFIISDNVLKSNGIIVILYSLNTVSPLSKAAFQGDVKKSTICILIRIKLKTNKLCIRHQQNIYTANTYFIFIVIVIIFHKIVNKLSSIHVAVWMSLGELRQEHTNSSLAYILTTYPKGTSLNLNCDLHHL